MIIGYVIGTGSVTSMVISGAEHGLSLSWALFLSCFFTFFLLVAISKLTIVSGETLMFNFKIHFGRLPTLFIMIALLFSIVSSVIGVMGIVAEVVAEWIAALLGRSGILPQVWIALIFIVLLIILYWTGKHRNFIKGMSIMVGLMALSFLLTSLIVLQGPDLEISRLFPNQLENANPALLIAGLVGTTMASVVLVSRSILVQEQNWKLNDLAREKKDAAWSMGLTFLISLAIMFCAAGTLYIQGFEVENAIEMMKALEPFAGEFAMSIFAVGIVAAGLSSIFPNLLLYPWLISDYTHTARNTKRPLFRFIAVLVALSGTAVPLLGGKPIWILIGSQALSPFVMPLITLFLMVLLNKRNVMGNYKIGLGMNIALTTAFIFNCYMLYIAVIGFSNLF